MRNNIIGSNQTTPGQATDSSTLLTDTTTTTGLLIKFSAGAPATQKALQVKDFDGSVIFDIGKTGPNAYNMKVGSTNNVFRSLLCLNGKQNPVCLEAANGVTAQGMRTWSGTGAPSSSTVGTAQVGDRYYRRDGSAGTYYYVCTAAGTPGTWLGIA